MEQKFKRGNLVKVLQGQMIWSNTKGWEDLSPQNVGRLAIIRYSYAEKYSGKSSADKNQYSIVWLDNGSSEAWKSDDQLELVEEGGEHLFAEAEAKRIEISKANTDLKEILKTWNDKQGKLSSETILFLFDKVGLKSSFSTNGEFYCLFSDWHDAYPLFNALFTEDKTESISLLNNEVIPEIYRIRFTELFNEIKKLKL
jgi:hypothetical protein